MAYTVLGLSNDDKHVELHNETLLLGAKQWVALYTRFGNWGGYYGLAIVDEKGDWVETFDAPEQETET